MSALSVDLDTGIFFIYPPIQDKLSYMAVKRALAALEAAALKGDEYINQVSDGYVWRSAVYEKRVMLLHHQGHYMLSLQIPLESLSHPFPSLHFKGAPR